MKHLKVKIPRRFKERLEARFTYENAILIEKSAEKVINIGCPLCFEYRTYVPPASCGECPFAKFEKRKERNGKIFISYGCIQWLKRVLKRKYLPFLFKDGYIVWKFENDREVKECLDYLKEKEYELIKWVDC